MGWNYLYMKKKDKFCKTCWSLTKVPGLKTIGLARILNTGWLTVNWASKNKKSEIWIKIHRYSGPCFNINLSSYPYRKSHCGDKMILRPSYLHNGISYTGKMTSLYWISPSGHFCSRHTGLILGLRPANERRRYFVTTSLIGWARA